MAEVARNLALAMAAVTVGHIALLVLDHTDQTVVHTQGSDAFIAPAGHCQEEFSDRNSGGGAEGVQSTGMPMDGLREMFEFASAHGTWGVSNCNRPDLGHAADGAKMMKRTNEVYPEQIGGQHAVVNAFENEGVSNGGGVDAGGVAAFDGWGDVAAFDACQ